MQQKWYFIDNEIKSGYSHENPIKFLTSSIELSLCDYANAYVLVTGNIVVVGQMIMQKLHLKIEHYLENAEQK